MYKCNSNQTAPVPGIPDNINKKTCCLRTVFILSMVAAAAICGSVAYVSISRLEKDLAVQSYYNIAKNALKGAQAIEQRKLQGCNIIAAMFSHTFPNASSWPFVALAGYHEITSLISELSSSQFTLTPIVLADQVSDFEAFAWDYFRDEGLSNDTGVSMFGFGIWKRDVKGNASAYPDGRLHDTEINPTRKYPYLTPIIQHTNSSSQSVMFNTYSDLIGYKLLDSMIDCSNDAKATNSIPQCGTLSGFYELITRPGPAAVLRQPVYPENDPTTVVSFIASSILWSEILKDVVPEYVSGLYVIISSGNESYTYSIEQGTPKLLGKGDLHDHHYEKYKQELVLSGIESNANATATYTLAVYPSEESFEGKSPWAITIGFVVVIIICTSIFFLYDYLIRNESYQRKVILEVKRRFVRFVSHEIRTPLNTVCLGLQLLQAEGMSCSDKNDETINLLQESNIDRDVESTKCTPHWSGLVDDILENANSAVGILNDLLSYDKMEQGTFKLEVGAVPIWDLVTRTVSAFDIQAKKLEINLSTKIEKPNGETTSIDFSSLNVFGDDVRLRQVIRNIISNSLKFCPEHTGIIQVTMMHNPDGLPNAITPRSDLIKESMSNDLACSYPRAGSIKIVFKDNGVGMTEAQLQRTFQEGIQFEPNKLQDGGGSGLGLHITKGLVETHGGTIEMFSEGHNLGCTTVVELPLYKYAATIRASSMQHSTHREHFARSLRPSARVEHICLVVDDSLPNRKMLARLLENSGHRCLVACDGSEAIRLIEADREAAFQDENHLPIDTILMDYEMPVLNGPDATKQLREKGCNATIIGVTGNVLAEDVSHFIGMGANKVLPKPVNMVAIEECWKCIDVAAYNGV